MSDSAPCSLAEWLAAFDDLLTARWHHSGCTVCGARPVAWEEIRTLPSGPSLAARYSTGDDDL